MCNITYCTEKEHIFKLPLALNSQPRAYKHENILLQIREKKNTQKICLYKKVINHRNWFTILSYFMHILYIAPFCTFIYRAHDLNKYLVQSNQKKNYLKNLSIPIYKKSIYYIYIFICINSRG